MSKVQNVFVFSDKAARMPELMAGAAALGEKVTALVIGGEAEAKEAASYGAVQVYAFAKKDGVMQEDYAPSFAKVIKDCGGKSVVMLPADKRGKAVGARLSVLLGAAAVNEAASVQVEGDGVTVTHMVYGGLAHGTEKITSDCCILTVGSGVYEGAAPNASRQAEVKTGEFVAPAHQAKLISVKAKEGSSVDLGKAKRVVCVGRGFAKQEDISLARDLAALIDAEVGCSRPIAEGEGWMERERYVGVSGIMLKSDVYLALGVSGQIQHMVGANAAKTIIAVNKDKNAPIFNFTDYGIVGDIYKVVPALINALK